MKSKRWVAITEAGTKQKLNFATETLGKRGIDWEWMPSGSRWRVGIPEEEYDRIETKYKNFQRNFRKNRQKSNHADVHRFV